ncbi:hypothetical protein SAY86_001353 [Trapa natans]|uniref:AP2/ERF domain-containing protein n=1 Tax=Trapa natans TaxID=22666 RepID=A0AAN7RHJ2_TRANT|nr:hypothetical protein SAY86_001353 [Trapa natans]
MSSSEEGSGTPDRKYSGVRRRKWGKWVSEIRVPGTQERLWLGTYSTPEGAAVAHDIAHYCLRQPASLDKLNFPSLLPPGLRTDMSPESVQKAASDAGMAIDARLISERAAKEEGCVHSHSHQYDDSAGGGGGSSGLTISVEDYYYL